MTISLTHEEELRYNRQIILRGFDYEKQECLKSSTALIVGLGGLGCTASQYLAAAGIGKLILLDFDTVSLSNLQRQILHTDQTIGLAKVFSAQQALETINPHINISCIPDHLDDEAFTQVISNADIVLDCTDNVLSREQINRLCYMTKTPLISGSAIRMEGQLMTFTYQDNEPCYQCFSALFGKQVLSCVETGVMSPLVGMVGSLQAMETVKQLTHYGHIVSGKILFIDAMTMEFKTIQLSKRKNCPVCHLHATK